MRAQEIQTEPGSRYILYFDNRPVAHFPTEDQAKYQAFLIRQRVPDLNYTIKREVCKLEPVAIKENLRQWFREKWVRFGPDGKIRGACARGSSKEGKPKCLPRSKAQALGQKGRASAASRKRRQDPNPQRSGSAINVATRKKQ